MDIGIDVDGVICNFQRGLIKRAKNRGVEFYDHWTQWRSWDTDYPENFDRLFSSVEDDWEFWVDLEPYDHVSKADPMSLSVNKKGWLPFEPEMYVSSRPIAPDGVTRYWLKKHGFPDSDVYIVDDPEEKLDHISEVDIYIDDRVQTIRYIQKNWKKENDTPVPVLFSMPWNNEYSDEDVSDIFYRARSLTDITKTDSIKEILQV